MAGTMPKRNVIAVSSEVRAIVSRLDSATKAEFGDERTVTLNVNRLDVIQHSAATTDEHEQATT